MSVVARIKEQCKKKGTNIAALEKLLEFGNGTIRKWDVNSPSLDKLQKVADYFKVTMDYLAGRVEHPHALEAPPELKQYGVEEIELLNSLKASGYSPKDVQEWMKFFEKQQKKRK